MKNTTKFTALLIVIISIISFSDSIAQSGVLKSNNGFLVFFSDHDLNFTIRLDEPNSEIPNWIDKNYLQLLKDHLYIQVIEKNMIIKNKVPVNNYLNIFQNWETDYIDSKMKQSNKNNAYINDNNSLKLKYSEFKYNAWYYAVDINPGKLYFYFLDIYKDGKFLRFTYTGDINVARLFMPVVFNRLQFYKKKINLNKLKYTLKNGEYSYIE